MARPLLVSFAAGATGPWIVESIAAIAGAPLAAAGRLAVSEGPDAPPPESAWVLKGVTSNLRYTTEREAETLAGRQQGLGRPAATRAALIPIRKSETWWSLAQDRRREIIEERSRHIAIGLDYLPAIARRLHHSRELGEPFDFVTWFEFAPEYAGAFDDLLHRLRASEEWRYVEREIDIRLRLD